MILDGHGAGWPFVWTNNAASSIKNAAKSSKNAAKNATRFKINIFINAIIK
jgi:hypothetical protein